MNDKMKKKGNLLGKHLLRRLHLLSLKPRDLSNGRTPIRLTNFYVHEAGAVRKTTVLVLERLAERGAVNDFPLLEVYAVAYPKLMAKIDAFLSGATSGVWTRSKRARHENGDFTQ